MFSRFVPAFFLLLGACATVPIQEEAPKHPVVTGNAAELTRVVSGPQDHFWARPSVDGSMLLFHVRDDSKQGDDRFSIQKVDVNKPGRTLVSQGAAAVAAWYPDNATFVYYTTRTGAARLVRSSVAGNAAGMTFLTPSPAGAFEISPDVSADGKRIAFVTSLDNPHPSAAPKGRADTTTSHMNRTIATINADGSSFTIYTDGDNPRWSPDGKKIVYDKRAGTQMQIFIIDISFGGQITQLTSGEKNNGHPAWSPDGKWVTFESDRDGAKNIWAMSADGTTQTQLTRGATDDLQPAWSSDGYIYFSSKAAGNYEIWRIRPLLGDRTRVAADPGR